MACSTTFTPAAWKKGRYTSYMTKYEMIFELTNAIFWCNLMFIIVLQLMLMQLRWTSTQVDYTHKKTVRAYHSLGTLISPQGCFWKDDLQIGSYINAHRRDQPSKWIFHPFLDKRFWAKKTNPFLEEKLFWFSHDETDKIYKARMNNHIIYFGLRYKSSLFCIRIYSSNIFI